MIRCEHCGGSGLFDAGEELVCLACGRSVGSIRMDEDRARVEVEADAVMEWNEYVAGRRETASARYGANTREDRAKYQSKYYETHREKAKSDTLRWKLNNLECFREYRRRRRMFSAFGVCLVCGLPIHFSFEYGWTHYRKDRAFHPAECFRAKEGLTSS